MSKIVLVVLSILIFITFFVSCAKTGETGITTVRYETNSNKIRIGDYLYRLVCVDGVYYYVGNNGLSVKYLKNGQISTCKESEL